jgi:hypothetical protein
MQTLIPGTENLARPKRPSQNDFSVMQDAMTLFYNKELIRLMGGMDESDECIKMLISNYDTDGYSLQNHLIVRVGM